MLLTLLLSCTPTTAAPMTGGKPAFVGCVVDQVVDIGMDGKADWRWRTTYDRAGRELLTASDQGNTGRTRGGMRSFWNEDGKLQRREWDGNGDGKAELVTSHEYEQGRKVRELQDRNGDGVPDETRLMRYEDDRLAGEDVVSSDPKRPASTVRYAYDDRGNRVLQMETVFGATVPSWIRTWTFDQAGNAVREETDNDITGIPSVVQTTSYDVKGRPTETRWDTDRDGKTNNFAFWQYDCPGG